MLWIVGLGDVRRVRLLGLHAHRREILVDLADETRAGRGITDDRALLAELAGLLGDEAVFLPEQ